MRASAAVTLALGLGLGLGCGGSTHASAPAPLAGAAAVDPGDRLLAFVPPDASFVIMRDRYAGLAGRFGNPAQTAAALRGLRASLDPKAGAGTAFVAALIDLMVSGSFSESVGWHEGDSVMVAYGLGLSPVVRATLDGARLRATLEQAAATSGFPLTTASWKGRRYYRIELPLPGFPLWLLLRLDDHEAVAAVTGEPDRLLEHVMATAPPGPRFDPAAIVAAAYPDRRSDAHFSVALYPARLAAAFGQVVARSPAWMASFKPCAATGVELLAATPALAAAWVPGADAFEAVVLIDVAERTADRLTRELRAIPRWPADGDGFRLGFGVGVRTLIEVSEPWFTAFDRTATACGSAGDTVATLHRALDPAPVALVDAAVMTYDPVGPTIVAALAAHDLQALWAALRTLLPLRPQPPAPAEQLTLPGAVFMGGVDALGVGGGGGQGAAAALSALMATGPGPREVFALDFGRRFVEQMSHGPITAWADAGFTDLTFHGQIRDRRLAIEMRAALTPAAHPQLAH